MDGVDNDVKQISAWNRRTVAQDRDRQRPRPSLDCNDNDDGKMKRDSELLF